MYSSLLCVGMQSAFGSHVGTCAPVYYACGALRVSGHPGQRLLFFMPAFHIVVLLRLFYLFCFAPAAVEFSCVSVVLFFQSLSCVRIV